jgi:drug/metabolite transporter (DMT)-like permease
VTTAVIAPRQRTQAELGLIGGSIAVFVWGLGPLFVRAMGVSSPTVVAYRLLLGGPVITGVAYMLGARFSWALFRKAFLSGAVFGMTLILGFAAVLNTSVANASLIGNMMPVIVVLLAHFVMGEHVRGRQFVAVGVSMVGLLIVVFGADSGGGASLWGDFLATANLGLWTFYFLRTKRLRDEGVDSWSLIATITVVAGLVAVPPCLLLSNDLGAVHGVDWWYLLGMAVGPGVLGHGLMTWAAKHLEVTVSALLTLASPVVSAVGAWWWLDQSMTAVQCLGAAIVLAALGAIAVNARVEAVRAATLSSERPE